MNTTINSVSPSTTSQQQAQPQRAYGVNALTPLLNPSQLELIQATVRAYVQEQRAATRLEALPILQAQSSGVAAVDFELTSLLQLLSWRHLIDGTAASLSDKQLRQVLDNLLDGEQGKAIGNRINAALGWYGSGNDEPADPMIIRQLVWKALILELDPPAQRKPGHIAGYEFGKPQNWGRPLSDIREEFEALLSWTTRNVQGGRSRSSARLAALILAPTAPEWFVKGAPKALRYGNGVWVNYAHGVALAEALVPGMSQTLGYEQLMDLPLKMGHSATDSERDIIVQTRIAPVLQWAIANNVLSANTSSTYGTAEIQTAMAAFDERQQKVVSAINALLRKVPDRMDIGLKAFNEALGWYFSKSLLHLRMRPTTLWKRVEYSLRNPSPSTSSGEFFLIDVFIAGYLIDGMDKFEPAVPPDQVYWNKAYKEQVELLKGIDVNAMYQEAFDRYSREAQEAYSCLLEVLIAEIPYSDRLAIEHGRVDLYLLEQETGIERVKETPRDRELRQGRAGSIIVCRHGTRVFAYEIFPLLGIVQRRTDLPPLPDGGTVAVVGRELRRAAVSLPLDWEAYAEPKPPRPYTSSRVIPRHLNYGLPSDVLEPSASPLSSPRIESLAERIAAKNLFFDKETEFKLRKGQTGSEFVTANYPPVLRMMATLIPGLSCVNAVVNDESPTLACVIDVGLILGSPAFKFAKGFVSLAMNAGAPAVSRSLPAFATLTRKFISRSGASYMSGLNPFDGFFFRWGGTSGVSVLLLKSAYKLHEAVGQTLGSPGEFAYMNGLESAANSSKWRPIAVGDRLATMINGVSDVPVRDFPTTDGAVRTYLLNTLSGYPYGPALEGDSLPAAPSAVNSSSS